MIIAYFLRHRCRQLIVVYSISGWGMTTFWGFELVWKIAETCFRQFVEYRAISFKDVPLPKAVLARFVLDRI